MINQSLDFDQKLYADLRKGSKAAFTIVFNRYARLLYALAYRYLKSTEEAEDAVQYTFMRLWEHRQAFDFQKRIRSLLFTILKNYVLNELRHRKIVFEKHYEMAQQNEETDECFLKELERTDIREHITIAINKLPPQKRKICMLKIDGKLSNQEIADKMLLSMATVKSHYTEAIKMLRTEIKALSLLLPLINLTGNSYF